jgi:hypothetical protein
VANPDGGDVPPIEVNVGSIAQILGVITQAGTFSLVVSERK